MIEKTKNIYGENVIFFLDSWWECIYSQ